jgi:peroxiredoxin
MITSQQANLLFVYADWAMLFLACVALSASIGWAIFAILPRYKGRRKRVLRTAAISFLVFAMFYGTQASVVVALSNKEWNPMQIVLFALPVVVMLGGLAASITFGVHAILRRTGKQRKQMVLKSLLGVVVFCVGVAPHTLVMLGPIISAEDHANRPGTLTHVGEPAPDFQLTSIEGTPFHTVNLRGKVIVLNFFATWCGPCQMELPGLQAVWDEFRNDDDFRMLVIGREESEASVRAFQQEHGFTFPLASDPDRSVYDKFASQSIPRTYLISRQGTIVHQSTGFYEAEISRLKKLLRKELEKGPTN